MYNINKLLETGTNVTLSVTPIELKEFALTIINEATILQKQQPEQYLTTDETAQRLQVSTNTLWRWAKMGYLVPVKTGRKPHYRLSDIEKLLNGKEG